MIWKALTWLIPGAPIVSTIVSIIGTVLGAILKAIGWFLTKTLDTFTRMLANPATFVVAGVFLLVAFGGGIRLGVKWDAHLVRKATERMQTAEKERDEANAILKLWEIKHHEENQRADAAAKARAIAEAKARAALAALAKSRGVRDGGGAALAKAGPQKAP